MKYSITHVKPEIITNWFKIITLEKYYKEMKPQVIVNEELFPIFFRLAFVRKLTDDKPKLGIDHYYVAGDPDNA